MTRTRLTPLLLALTSAALLAGCGGGSKSTSTSTPAATTPAASTATTSSTGIPTSTSASSLSGPQRVETCNSVVRSLAALPTSAKQKIEAICAKARVLAIHDHLASKREVVANEDSLASRESNRQAFVDGVSHPDGE